MSTLGLIEAAAILRIHPDTLREEAAVGNIPGAKIGRRWVFIEADLIEHIRTKYKGSACSTSAVKSGGPSYGTAGDSLDALLGPVKRNKRNGSTTSSRPDSGPSAKAVALSKTRSSHG